MKSRGNVRTPWLLDGGPVMVCRGANEIYRGGVSVAAAFANSPASSLPGMPL